MSVDKWDFLFAVCSEPDNLTHRLVYADFLEEHNDPERAEYIRLACEPKPPGCGNFMYSCSEHNWYGTDLACQDCKNRFRWDGLQAKAKIILGNNWQFWKTESGLGGTFSHDPGDEDSLYRCEWNNGFVEEVTCNGTWADFIRDAPVIFRNHPVRKFSFPNVRPNTDRGNERQYWFSDRFLEEEENLGDIADDNWIPWEVAQHFPTADRIETGYGGRSGVPRFNRHYWTFTNTIDSAALWLSNQLCRYGFQKAWEDRLRDSPRPAIGVRGSDPDPR